MIHRQKPPLPSGESDVRPLISPAYEVPFIGRDRELQLIDRCMEAVDGGQGTLVLIEGVTGVGKSALLRMIHTRAMEAEMKSAAGQCYERGIAPPYGPWRDIFGQLAAECSATATGLPEPLGGQTPAFSSHQLAELAAAYLREIASSRPVVVLLDDLHWADRESLDLLDHTTRKLDRTAALIIAAYCVEEVGNGPLSRILPSIQRDRPVTKLALAPLDGAASQQLADRYGLTSAPALEGLYRRSGGVPLYLIELLKDWQERNRLAPTEEGFPVPTFLEQTFTRRIERLHPDVAEFLEVAAAVGEVWPLAVVEGVLGWPEERLLGALEAALDARLLEGVPDLDEGYRFAHGLIQETLYARLIVRRRRHLHARIAAVLENERNATHQSDEDLAYHYAAAADRPRAACYSIAAADAARHKFANHAAIKLYRQAAHAVERDTASVDPATRVALFSKKGDTHMTLGQKEEAEASFSQMLEAARTAGDTVAECRALCAISTINEWQYRFPEAHRNAKAALALAKKSASSEAIVAAHLNYAHLFIVDGRYREAYPHVEAVERLAVGDDFCRERGMGMQFAGYLAIFRGDYASAHRLASQAQDLAQEGGDFLTMGGASFSLGLSLGEQAKYTQARAAVRAGLASIEDSGEVHYSAKLHNVMGWLHNQVGDYDTALRWNERALEASRRADAGGVIEAECYSLLNIITDELCLGRIARAEGRLAELEALLPRAVYSRPRYFNRYLLCLAELALANDESEVALMRAHEACDFAAAHNFRKNVARGELLAGRALLLSAKPEAAEPLRQARQIADEIVHPALRWQTRLYLYQALAASGENAASLVEEAGRQVQAILTGIDDLHWKACLEATEPVRQLRAACSTAENRTGKASPAGLTPREVEVLRWVADGATNQMIAGRLYISVKTVNTHVQSILRKTRSDNRAAAAAFAARHGLITTKS